MNKIIYAGRETSEGERTAKSFEILVPDGPCGIQSEINLTADKGQAVIIPPLKKHTVKGFAGLRIVFENALLPFGEICVICDNEERAIYFAAEQALKYFESPIAKRDLILTSLGNLLISYATAFGFEKEFSPAVELVRAEIARRVSDCTFTVKDALKKLPLNYDYIRKLFKKETGATPSEYLLKERMALAQQLISSGISNKFSEYSVSQVAEACGFSEPLYFSRVFKKYFGVPPSEYR